MACSVNAGNRDATLDDAEDIKSAAVSAAPTGTGARNHVVVVGGGWPEPRLPVALPPGGAA